jgi:hypothetical protein
MTRFLVASNFVWAEYPGLRPGRIYAGLPDVARHPGGEAHLVAGPDAAETLCGRPRASFPYEFPALTELRSSDPCATCRRVSSPGS